MNPRVAARLEQVKRTSRSATRDVGAELREENELTV